jgi:hypothetical protein
LMLSLCSTTSLEIPFMSEGFHANTSRFTLRKSTSVLSYLGSSTVPIQSLRPSSEMTVSLTSLAGGLERAGRTLERLKDVLVLGTRPSLEPRGSGRCFSELKALNVALVCALVHRPYCDDTHRSRDFQF